MYLGAFCKTYMLSCQDVRVFFEAPQPHGLAPPLRLGEQLGKPALQKSVEGAGAGAGAGSEPGAQMDYESKIFVYH